MDKEKLRYVLSCVKGGASDFLGSIQSESEQKQRTEDHDTDDRHDAKEV